jgi:integrase
MIYFKLIQQGKLDPVIQLQVFDARFPKRRCFISLGHRCKSSAWYKTKERPKNDEKLSEHLDTVKKRVEEFLNARRDSATLAREDLRAYLESKKKDERREYQEKAHRDTQFFKVWEDFISNGTHPETGEPLSVNTLRAKKQTMRLLKEFATEKKLTITFENIDMQFYNAFNSFMIAKGLEGNSRGKHFKELKALLRRAGELGIQVNNSYTRKAFKVLKRDVESTFLNIDELKRLLALKLDGPHAVHRDIFVMACFVGARHSDWYQIRSSNIVKENKVEMIRIRQKKTGDAIHVPLHPITRMILNKYNGNPPRVISSQKFNEALKEICKHEDLKLGKVIIDKKEVDKWKTISTHTARRSFATNAYLSKSMQVYEIMKCTGHRTEASFLKYLKLDGRDYAAKAAESKFFSPEEWKAVMEVAV